MRGLFSRERRVRAMAGPSDEHERTMAFAEIAIGSVNAKISEEIDQVMALVDSAVRSANKHDASLADVTSKLGRANDRDAVRGIIESLVQTAADMKRGNQALEATLKASKQEISQLRQNLETVRNESLIDRKSVV